MAPTVAEEVALGQVLAMSMPQRAKNCSLQFIWQADACLPKVSAQLAETALSQTTYAAALSLSE
jgi:hypothetical protein